MSRIGFIWNEILINLNFKMEASDVVSLSVALRAVRNSRQSGLKGVRAGETGNHKNLF